MNGFLRSCLLLSVIPFYFDTATAEAAILTIGPGITIIVQAEEQPTKAPIASPSSQLTRKKHTASILFQGLAQTCALLGQTITTENQKEKQQGALNVLGTVFNVAAQLSAPSQQPAQQPPANLNQQQPAQSTQQQQQPPTPLTTKLVHLSSLLLQELDKSPVKYDASLAPLLAAFKSLKTDEEKQSFIATILSLPSQAKQYIEELFTALQQFLQIYLPETLNSLEQYLFSYLEQLGAKEQDACS